MPTSGLSATSSTLTTSSLSSVSKVTQRKRPRRQIRPVEQFNPALPNTHAFYGGKYASNAKHMHGKHAEFEASDVGGEASEWSFRFDLDRYRHDEESQEDEEYVPPSAEENSFDEDSCSSGGDLELPELGQHVRWRWSLAGKKKGSAFGWFTGCVVGVDARSVSVRYDLDGETVSHDIASAHYGETWEEVGRLSAEQARDGVWVGEESSPRDMVVHSRPKRRRVAPELFQPGGDPRQTSFAIQDNGGLKEEQALRLAVRASLRT